MDGPQTKRVVIGAASIAVVAAGLTLHELHPTRPDGAAETVHYTHVNMGLPVVTLSEICDTITLSARMLRTADAAPEPAAVPSWRSAEPDIAQVDTVTGLVLALSPGWAQVFASHRGSSNYTWVQVAPDTLDPGTGHIDRDSVTLTAIDDTAHLAWVRDGLVLAGSDRLKDGMCTNVGIRVAPEATAAPIASLRAGYFRTQLVVGDTVRARPWAVDSAGARVEGAAIIYALDPTGVVTVDPDGLITALAPGTATVTAQAVGGSGNMIALPWPITVTADTTSGTEGAP